MTSFTLLLKMSTRFQKWEQTALSGHKYMFKTKRRINSDFYREIGWDSITTKVFETTTRCLVVRNTWMKTSCLSKASSKTNQLMHPDIIPIVHLRKVHSSIKNLFKCSEAWNFSLLAGRLQQFVQNWQCLTQNPEILKKF